MEEISVAGFDLRLSAIDQLLIYACADGQFRGTPTGLNILCYVEYQITSNIIAVNFVHIRSIY